MKHRFRAIALLAVLAAAAPPAGAQSPPAAAIAERLAGLPVLGDPLLSPDGNWVTYQVTRRHVANNRSTVERMLVRVPRDGAPPTTPRTLPAGVSAVAWCPDSRCLSMLRAGAGSAPPVLLRYAIEGGTMTRVPLRDTAAPGRPRIDAVGSDYRWSPRGNFLAFSAALNEHGGLDLRRGVSPEQATRIRPNALFVLDAASGALRQVTPDTLHVGRLGSFDWSPDERHLVVAVDRDPDSQGTDMDLVVVPREGGTVRALVTRPAKDELPRWSPDGRFIAFASHYGTRSYQSGWPAFVPADGGPVIELPRDPTPMGFRNGWWAMDSQSFYYEANLDMTSVLVRADPARREATVLPAPAGTLRLPHDAGRSASRDGRRMAFTRQSLQAPAELLVTALHPDGRPDGQPTLLTRLSEGVGLDAQIHIDTLSWPSSDGRFTIHALLLAPASAVRGGALQGPLPTVLSFIGGPSMVNRGFAADGFHGAQQALALRGYLVLVPNTRGRGGYGAAFTNAIGTERNRGRAPLADAMGGLDLLVARGLADPERMGVIGHSYGGYLTSYTVTQTNRFKAAVNHEGGPLFLTTSQYFGNPPGGWRDLLSRDLYGVHNPFDPAELQRLVEESPGLQAGRIRTPMLLQYGVQSWAEDHGRPLYNALRRVGTPSALFLYDEGHVFNRPAAIADDLTRTVEWLDYWVRGIPFPAVRAAEYGVK